MMRTERCHASPAASRGTGTRRLRPASGREDGQALRAPVHGPLRSPGSALATVPGTRKFFGDSALHASPQPALFGVSEVCVEEATSDCGSEKQKVTGRPLWVYTRTRTCRHESPESDHRKATRFFSVFFLPLAAHILWCILTACCVWASDPDSSTSGERGPESRSVGGDPPSDESFFSGPKRGRVPFASPFSAFNAVTKHTPNHPLSSTANGGEATVVSPGDPRGEAAQTLGLEQLAHGVEGDRESISKQYEEPNRDESSPFRGANEPVPSTREAIRSEGSLDGNAERNGMFSGIPERPEAVQTLLNAAASSSSTLYDGQEKHRSADVERGGGRTRDEGGSSVATGGGRFSYYAGDVVLKRTVSPDGKSSSEWRPARHEGKGGGKRQFVRGGSNSLHVGPPTSTDSNTFFTPSLYRRMCLKVFVHDGSARLFAVLLLQNLEWPTFTKYRLGTAMFLNNLRRKAASFDEHRDSQYAFLDCCPLHKIAAKGLSYLRARVHRHSDLRRIKRELQTSSREFSYSVRHLPAVRKQVSSRTGLFQALLVTWDLFATSILKFKLFKVGGPEALMTHGQKSRYFMDLAEHLLDLWFSERAFFAPLMWAYGSFAPVVNDAPFRRPQQSTSILLMDGMKDYLFGERPHHQMGAGLLYTSRQLDALRWLEGRVKEAVYQKLQKALRRFQGFPVVSSSSAPFYRGHRSHAAGDVPFLDHFPALFRDKRLPTVQVTGYFLRGERGDEVKAGVFGDKIADDRVEELMAGLPAHSALLQLTMVDAWAWNRCTDEGGANGECPEARAGGRAAPSWSPYGVRLQDDSAPLGRYLPVSTASQLLNIELRWDPSLLNAAGRTVVLLNDIVGLDSAGVQGPEADPAMDLDVHAVLLLPVRDFSSAEDVRRDVVRLVSSRTPSRLYAKSAQQSGLLDPSRVKILGTARWVGSNQPRLLLGEFGRGISSRGVQGSLDLLERGSILVHISIAGIARKFRVPEDKSSGQTADDGVGSGAGTAQDGQNAARARTAFLGGAEEAGLGAAAQAGWGMTAKEAYRRLVRRTQGGPARVVYVQTSVEEFPKAKADKKKQRRGGRIPWMAVAISNMCVFFFFLIIFVYLHWRRHVDLPWWLKCVCTSAAPWMEDDDASEAADSDNQRESCDSSCEGSESVDERSYSSTADPDGFSSARERSSSLTSWSLGGCPSRASRYPTAASVPREGGSPFDSYFQSPLSLVPLVTELPSVMGREFSGSAAVPLGCGWPGGAVQSPLYVLYRAQLPHLEWARRERESAHASFPRRGSLGLSLPRGGSGGALPVSRAQESAQTGISRSATDGDTVGNRAETFAGSADRQEALETGSPGPRDACPGTDGEKDGAEAGCDYELVVRFVDSRERRSSWV